MEKRDATNKADYWIETMLKSQPQFVVPNFASTPEAGANLATQLLALRKSLIEGLQTQD